MTRPAQFIQIAIGQGEVEFVNAIYALDNAGVVWEFNYQTNQWEAFPGDRKESGGTS